uniref:Putative structural protein n=1 Tax=viral metagenome TaxID=1070528 RepID=A0A6M3IVB2_9ZZZZ
MEMPADNKEDKLRDFIIREVEESQVAQYSRINEVKEYTKRYEAKRSISGLLGWGDDPKKNPKTEPWEGASDVGIPIDAFTIEGLLPRFLKVCYGSKPIVWTRGVGQSDIQRAPIVQEALNYQLTRLIKIYRKMKLVFKTVAMEGDGFAKCVWEKTTRPFNKVVYNLQNPLTGELILNPENGQPIEVKEDDTPQPIDEFGTIPTIVRNESQEEKTIYEGPQIYGRTIKEIIIPKNAISPEIEDWDWICDTYEKTYDWLERNEGDIKEGKFKNIDKIKEKVIINNADHNKAMRTPILVYEWYGKYDINDDNKDEEIIAFVCPKYKVLLGWMLSPFQVRPFFHYQIIPMEGKPYGKGVPEFLIGMRDMIDAIFNQMIDRGSISNNPPIIVPSDHEDELNPFGPGVKWKSENPNAYRVLELPKTEQMEFAKLEFCLGMVQKLFGVMDYAVGETGGLAGNRTASGIMSVIGEGNIKFDDMIRALQDTNEDLYNFIVNLNSENLDDDFIYQLTEQQDNPFKTISKSYWGGNFDFESVGNSININRQIEQDRSLLAYNTVVNSYGKNPAINELTMLDVSKNLFSSIDVRNVRLKTEEEMMQEKQLAQQQAEQQQQMIAGQAQAQQQNEQAKLAIDAEKVRAKNAQPV